MSPLAVRRAPLWSFLCAGLGRTADAIVQFLALQPGSKLADGVQKKLALLP